MRACVCQLNKCSNLPWTLSTISGPNKQISKRPLWIVEEILQEICSFSAGKRMPSSEKHSEGSLANMDGSSNRVQTCQARLANGYLVAIFAKCKVGSKWFEYQLPCAKKRGSKRALWMSNSHLPTPSVDVLRCARWRHDIYIYIYIYAKCCKLTKEKSLRALQLSNQYVLCNDKLTVFPFTPLL